MSSMPELPEVECLRRSLEPHLLGARCTGASLLRGDMCRGIAGAKVSPTAMLKGRAVASLERLGKNLAIVSNEGAVLCVHLGMSGQVLIEEREEPRTHVHARWTFTTPGGRTATMTFRDPRRFGGLAVASSMDAVRVHAWAGLGPDALSIDAGSLRERAGRSARAIKSILLDQRVLAGVGNIYADEALFAARIHPERPGNSLAPREWAALAARVRDVLASAIASGGSTLRDYVNANGAKGRSQHTHAVYGRGGETCTVCEKRLTLTVLGGRATVYCARCQPASGTNISTSASGRTSCRATRPLC